MEGSTLGSEGSPFVEVGQRGPRALRDDELLRRARTDADAFGVFFDRHAARVHRYLARATEDANAATDLTAETFAQALVALDRFRGSGDDTGAAWIFGIARRVLWRSLRSQRREAGARRRLGIPPDTQGWDETQSDARLDGAALGRALARALDTISGAQAAAVRLRVVEQLDYAEIGRALGCSPLAARIRVSRGLRALLDRLEGGTDD